MELRRASVAGLLAFCLTLGAGPAQALSLGYQPIALSDGEPDEAPALPERPRSSFQQLPITAAALSVLVPGLGHLAIGEPKEAAIALGATIVPTVIGSANVGPDIFADLPEQRSSLWLLTAQEVWFVQAYMAYMAARAQIDNAGYPQPYREPSVSALVTAPFSPANALDWRVWLTVWISLAANIALELALPDPPTPETPSVFEAASATVWGRTMPSSWGYGLHLAGSGVLSAHAGIGEEALFRGVFQDEAERHLGRWGGLLVGSSLFGAVHIGGINQTSAIKQFLGTGLGGACLGFLYQETGYDLSKSIAAHTYYDMVAFGLSGLYPKTKGNNVFGLQYNF